MLELNPSTRKEVAREVLRECCLTTYQALVDAVGSEEALRILRVHFRHSGRAYALNLRQALGEKSDPLWIYAMSYPIGNQPMSGGCQVFRLEGKELIGITRGCPNAGVAREFCLGYCQFVAEGEIEVLLPEMEVSFRPAETPGGECVWKARRRDGSAISWDNSRFDVAQVANSLGERDLDMIYHYLGECWVIATRAFLEKMGEEEALSLLRPQLRARGMSYGIMLRNQFGLAAREAADLAQYVLACYPLHMMSLDMERGNEAEAKVRSCPYSDSPRMICALMGSFMAGVVEAASPGHEFLYMSQRGEDGCEWVIRCRK